MNLYRALKLNEYKELRIIELLFCLFTEEKHTPETILKYVSDDKEGKMYSLNEGEVEACLDTICTSRTGFSFRAYYQGLVEVNIDGVRARTEDIRRDNEIKGIRRHPSHERDRELGLYS